MSRTVLLLEDDFIIRLGLIRSLEALGIETVAAFDSSADALAYLDREAADFALLDFRLARSETSAVVAARLIELGVPFAFSSGLGEIETDDPALSRIPCFEKPLRENTLRAYLEKIRLL